jgi:hypothetical protein
MTAMRHVLGLCLCTAIAAAQIQNTPPAEPPAVTGTGSIEGVVTDSATHEPVKKAQVTLNGPAGPPLTAVTDSGGRFAFHDLPAGMFWMNAWKPGYRSPQSVLGADFNSGITLGQGEQKQDVAIALTRDGSIAGRVTDEEGNGVRGCSVTAVAPGFDRGRRVSRGLGGASTDDKGDYRITDLTGGQYQVFVHCGLLLPAPHPLMPPDDPRTPHETYMPRFYGGALDPATATRIAVTGGAAANGIDFQVTRVAALAVRGSVTAADPEALAGGVNLLLAPSSGTPRPLLQWSAYADPAKRNFEFQAVVPGSYTLYAFSMQEGRLFSAERAVELGKASPAPLEISLSAGADLKGIVQFDSDDHRPPEGVGQVSLMPIGKPMFGPQPMARIGPDGTFTLSGVLPGRWRLTLHSPHYIKSVSLGGQSISPYGFDVAGPAGPLVIVVGTNSASLNIHIAGDTPDRPVSALIYPEDPDRMGAGLERAGSTMGGNTIQIAGLPPGRYRVFATDSPNPWPVMERPDVLHALENRTALIDVPEGGQATTTVEIIPRADLLRLVETQE